MPWQGIWFEHEARSGGARDPEWFEGEDRPVVYPYVHNFVEAEEARLRSSPDPGIVIRDRRRVSVYYSIGHDGSQSGLDQQGCRVLNWLFGHFEPNAARAGSSSGDISARFSEIPIVIHDPDPTKAAALGNALTLLRFLSASEDQAIAKMLLHRWNPLQGSPRLAALDYERRVFEFLNGELFYPEDVTLFDILERHDLKSHRTLPVCCQTQIGFVLPLLEWVDECWPESEEEARELQEKLRNSLADEARYVRTPRAAVARAPERPPVLGG